MTREDIEWIKSLNADLSEDEAIALTFIKKNNKITNGDYQKLNNTNRDKTLIDLKKLIGKGLIESQGVGSGTYYVLNNSIKAKYHIDSLDSTLAENNNLPPKMTTEDKQSPPKMATKDKEDDKVKEDEILAYCQVPRSKLEIIEYLGLKNKSHFEKNYLKVLLHDGRLQMTLPDKPTSGKQKYFAKKE